MIILKCKKHPTYKAKIEPTAECQVCWDIWRFVNDPWIKFYIEKNRLIIN